MLDNFGDTEVNLTDNPFGLRTVYFDAEDNCHVTQTIFHEIWKHITLDTKLMLVYDLLVATKAEIEKDN